MRKLITTTALITVLAMAGTLALAQGMRGHAMRGEGYGPGMADGSGIIRALMHLDLTDDQKDAIHVVLEEIHPQMDAAREIATERRQELHDTARDSGYNEALLRPLAEAQAEAGVELTMLRIRLHSEVVELLTPEQREELESFRDGRGRHGGHGHGRFPGGDRKGGRQAPEGGN